MQRWTWMGCLAEQRFADPVLLEARRGSAIVAMALFNRRRGWATRQSLWLGETGVPEFDAIFVEYNGILAEAGSDPGLVADCLGAALAAPIGGRSPWFGRRVVLSGVDATGPAAAREAGGVWVRRSLTTPRVDLAGLRRQGRCYLDTLSGNARYQIRRSDRAYAACGELAVRRADSCHEAHAFLDALAALHQASWTRRGQPGAFANPHLVGFHHALIERGLPRGEIDLLRVTAGGQIVGFLYNFQFRGRVLAYQNGFDYAGAGRHQKPGLTCHHQAIRLGLARGFDCYDFLAGNDRYKRSLADGSGLLHWIEVGAGWPVRRCVGWLRGSREPIDRATTSG